MTETKIKTNCKTCIPPTPKKEDKPTVEIPITEEKKETYPENISTEIPCAVKLSADDVVGYCMITGKTVSNQWCQMNVETCMYEVKYWARIKELVDSELGYFEIVKKVIKEYPKIKPYIVGKEVIQVFNEAKTKAKAEPAIPEEKTLTLLSESEKEKTFWVTIKVCADNLTEKHERTFIFTGHAEDLKVTFPGA